MFDALKIAASGLAASSVQLGVVASNLANINTTVTPGGGPYRREMVLLQSLPPYASGLDRGVGQGVAVAAIVGDPSPFPLVYNPTNPAANAQGYVAYPNVHLATEMVDMIAASRSYQADATAFQAAQSLDVKALTLSA